MKIQSAKFITSAASPGQFFESDAPEIAFGGRSNVGKSSLINMALNRKGLVKVSNTPGRTQLINFFEINESFFLVDLPGYGFAKAPVAVRKQWGQLIDAYIRSRPQLAAMVLLLDVRRKPSAEDEVAVSMFREQGIPTILAITKADKLPLQKRQKQVSLIAKHFNLLPGDCIVTSAAKGWGREELWNSLACFVDSPE